MDVITYSSWSMLIRGTPNRYSNQYWARSLMSALRTVQGDYEWVLPLQWRHNGHDGVSNNQPYECLLNCLLRRRSKKTSKLRVTGLCVGNSPGIGEFPAQMASSAENVFSWWRHHDTRHEGDAFWMFTGDIFTSNPLFNRWLVWIAATTLRKLRIIFILHV